MKKINLIIDTDPGVDDSIAIIPSLFDKRLNILLFTTVSGNVNVDLCTRNLLHILDYCKKDIPVAKGASKPLKRKTKDATFIHGPEGTGNLKITEQPKLKPIKKNAVEAMYEQICANKGNITVVLLGPQTNMAKLILKHPDVTHMVKRIIFMGTSDYGRKKKTPILKQNHISFNASSDPEALKIVLESGIPIVVVPSEIGRAVHLSEEEVLKIRKHKFIGEFLYQMLNGYWEPNTNPRVVSLNDSCAMLYLRFRPLFVTKRANIEVDTKEQPGKTVYKYKLNGKYKVVTRARLKFLHKFIDRNNK